MTTEELVAAGLPAERKFKILRPHGCQKGTPLLLLVGLGLMKMGRLDRKKKKSEMSTLMSKT
jgi:hypothetical protein